jgi:thiol-disulfide isomerase/thioredoxin
MSCKQSWIFFSLALTVVGAADPPPAPPEAITPAERELVEIVKRLIADYEAFLRAETGISEEERQRRWESTDPAAAHLPALLRFEEKHRGTLAGHSAASKVMMLAAGGGKPDNVREQAGRTLLPHLKAYRHLPEFACTVRIIGWGWDPELDKLLEELSNDLQASPEVRAHARFIRGKRLIEFRKSRLKLTERLAELKAGVIKPAFKLEATWLEARLAKLPADTELANLEAEGLRLLEELASSGESRRVVVPTWQDPDRALIRINHAVTSAKPTIAEAARGEHFRRSALAPGRQAPDLECTLLSGESWSLAKARGKVVIIQFTFKGCGPCEAMYPGLGELRRRFGDRLEILSICSDETEQVTRDAAAESKMTWSVCHDGYSGPRTTAWGVDSFPGVWLIDANGRIEAINLRGERLDRRVERLLAERKP